MNSSIFSSEQEPHIQPMIGWRYTFVWLTVAILLVVGFLCASEILIRVRVEPNDLLTRHMALLDASSRRNAIFGDSHASLGFTGQPDMINLAFPGENTATMVSKARAYFQAIPPGLVILQAGPHQFTPRRDLEAGRNYEIGDWSIGAVRVLSDWHRRQLPLYWRVVAEGGDFTSNRKLQADGAQTIAGNFATLSASTRRRQAQETVLTQIPPTDLRAAPGFKILAAFIPELIERGAYVCLVSFPVAMAYRREAERYPSFAAARRQIAALAARHGIRHIDMWDALEDGNAFANSDHMNHWGGMDLARRIRRHCQSPE